MTATDFRTVNARSILDASNTAHACGTLACYIGDLPSCWRYDYHGNRLHTFYMRILQAPLTLANRREARRLVAEYSGGDTYGDELEWRGVHDVVRATNR